MDINALVYSDNAANVQLVISAKDLRDFADRLVAFATQKIKEADEPDYYTREELMEKLHVSDPTLRSYREKGLIPKPVTIGGRVLYNKAEVNKAIEERKIKVRQNYKL